MYYHASYHICVLFMTVNAFLYAIVLLHSEKLDLLEDSDVLVICDTDRLNGTLIVIFCIYFILSNILDNNFLTLTSLPILNKCRRINTLCNYH